MIVESSSGASRGVIDNRRARGRLARVKYLLSALALGSSLFMTVCIGNTSTLQQRFAYRVSRDSAEDVVRGAIGAHVQPDRISADSNLRIPAQFV